MVEFTVTMISVPTIGPLQYYDVTWILSLAVLLVVIFAAFTIILKHKLNKREDERDFFISSYYDLKFGLDDKTREDATECGFTNIIKILNSWEATFKRMRSCKNKQTVKNTQTENI